MKEKKNNKGLITRVFIILILKPHIHRMRKNNDGHIIMCNYIDANTLMISETVPKDEK